LKFFAAAFAALLALSSAVFAGEPALEGVKHIALHTRDGKTIDIGTVAFAPKGDKIAFKIDLDRAKFQQYFLSMREFKCVVGPEVMCHVPYPYPNPDTVTAKNLSWLEHALIFFYKRPTDYGANMANGLIYTLKITPAGLVGTPQSIDLDEIAVPPENLKVPYYSADHRYDIAPGDRWIRSLTIE